MRKYADSKDQFKSVVKEFSSSEFGYAKMERCVTLVKRRSEADKLGVKVGWLEEKLTKVTLCNNRANKSSGKYRATLVHFLVPRRQVFYKVLWKALAATHCKIDHPERRVVGCVDFGIVLRIMDISSNRALVKCPKSGWTRHASGWLPNQEYAWISIRAKDGTSILEEVSNGRLKDRSLSQCPSVRTTKSKASSTVTKKLRRESLSSTTSRSSQSLLRKPAVHLDFRWDDPRWKHSQGTASSPILFDSRQRSRPIEHPRGSRASFHNFSQKSAHRTFIDLDFVETRALKPKNFTPLNFKWAPANNEKFTSKRINNETLDKEGKRFLTLSNTLSESITPMPESKYQEPDNKESSTYSCKSYSSESTLSSKMSWESKRNSKAISARNLLGKKLCGPSEDLSILMSDSKRWWDEAKLRAENESYRDSILTESSAESKHTIKSSEVSELRYNTLKKKKNIITREKRREIEIYADLLDKGFESKMPSVERSENITSDQENISPENITKLKRPHVHVTEPLNTKNNHNTLCDRIVDAIMLSVIDSSKAV